uniref:Uncharacterized protein n=1 Tax=Oryza barthii TaxID=65489 RepID=A0A0D3FWI8_9ORYZ
MEMHGGGGAYAAAATFFVACAASGGCGWSWGALFWAVPGFAQTHCFLLMMRQLKHAALAYYAVWIWS